VLLQAATISKYPYQQHRVVKSVMALIEEQGAAKGSGNYTAEELKRHHASRRRIGAGFGRRRRTPTALDPIQEKIKELSTHACVKQGTCKVHVTIEHLAKTIINPTGKVTKVGLVRLKPKVKEIHVVTVANLTTGIAAGNNTKQHRTNAKMTAAAAEAASLPSEAEVREGKAANWAKLVVASEMKTLVTAEVKNNVAVAGTLA